MEILDEITTEDFKDYFTYSFPYFVSWNVEATYYKKDEVYYNYEFYISLTNENTGNIPDDEGSTAWELVEDEEMRRFVTDTDIENAFVKAKSKFNFRLFDLPLENDIMKQCYLLLTACYLVKDLATAGRALESDFIIISKTVGSASATYKDTPTSKSKYFQYLESNCFGREYVSLVADRTTGYVMLINGTTTIF